MDNVESEDSSSDLRVISHKNLLLSLSVSLSKKEKIAIPYPLSTLLSSKKRKPFHIPSQTSQLPFPKKTSDFNPISRPRP
jgi:hypothetical protein